MTCDFVFLIEIISNLITPKGYLTAFKTDKKKERAQISELFPLDVVKKPILSAHSVEEQLVHRS